MTCPVVHLDVCGRWRGESKHLVQSTLAMLAAWLLLLLQCCCLVVDAGGCYDALHKELALTVSGAAPRRPPDAASCDTTTTTPAPELRPLPDGVSLVVTLRGGDAARLLAVRGVTSASQCRLQEPRDFLGPRGVLLRSWGRRDGSTACATLRPPLGCLRLLRLPGRRFSPESVWLPGPHHTVPPPSVSLLGSSASHVLLAHAFAAPLRGSTVAFFVRNVSCEFNHKAEDLTWFVNLTGNAEPDAVICENDPEERVTCGTTGSLEVVCNVTQLTQGSYCLYTVILDADRCLPDDSCVFHTPLEVRGGVQLVSPPPALRVPFRGAPAVVVALLTLALLATALCLAVHFLWPEATCLSNPWRLLAEGGGGPFTISETVSRKGTEVLLLYAYDCPPLMEAARSLRALLRRLPGAQVFDPFDRSLWHEVSRNPSAWLCGLMARGGHKVVLLETPCAALHQRSLYQGTKVTYRHPRAFADLFAKGLTLALHNVGGGDVYASHYVVRFEERGTEEDCLRHVTPFRRFVLPEAAESLLAEICPNYRASDLDLGDELKTLSRKIEDFVRYKRSNPRYLEETVLS